VTKQSIGIIIAILVILGGIAFLTFGKLEKNLVYFVTPTEILKKGASALNQSVRLGGMVRKGTIQWDPEKVYLEFILTDNQKEVRVVSHETPPQMFQEEMGVVVEGKMLVQGYFEAERLMVKHSNEYHPPKEGEKPHLIYKDITQ